MHAHSPSGNSSSEGCIFSEETIHLHRLEVMCIIGIRSHERKVQQPLWIDLSFPHSFKNLNNNTDLENSISYSDVARAIRAFIQQEKFYLLETLARQLTNHLFKEFQMKELQLHIQKPEAIDGCDGAGVSLTAHRTP